MLAILVNMIGGIALLFWGTYMVKTGMLRTFGLAFRSFLSRELNNRVSSLVAGCGMAVLLQSSTATALLLAGLQAEGVVTTSLVLAALMGADLGSAIVTRILSFNLGALAPVLIAAGTIIFFLKKSTTRQGQFGRILLGLGLVMIAISQIVAATMPLRTSPQLAPFFQSLAEMPPLAMVAGALLAFGCFSSLAAVVILSGLVTAGVLPIHTALWCALGANVESTLLPILTTLGISKVGKRGPVGNAFYRLCTISTGVVLLMAVPQISEFFDSLPDGTIYFHVAFNTVSALAGLLFIHPLARLADRVLPATETEQRTLSRQLLQENLQDSGLALANARHEVLRITRAVTLYWNDVAVLLQTNLPAGDLLRLQDKYEALQKRCAELSEYLETVLGSVMTAQEALSWQNIKGLNGGLKLALTLEDRILRLLAKEKCVKHLDFSPEGLKELLDQHAQVAKCLQGLQTLISAHNDPERQERIARNLIADREAMQKDAFLLTQQHLSRVEKEVPGSIETSALHLELLSLIRRYCAVVTSVCEAQ